MLKSGRGLIAFLLALFSILSFPNFAKASEPILFDKVLTISSWHLHASRHSFNAADAQEARVNISKNTPDTEIQRGFFLLNGMLTFLHDFLVGDEPIFEKDVALQSANTLIVFLWGHPGAELTFQVIGNDGPIPGPEIISFTAEPSIIKRGESATLTWQTLNAATCQIEPDIGAVDPNSSIVVSPTDTNTYTLTAEGTGDPARAVVTVTIENSPPVAQAGPDREVFVGDLIMLDGGGSVDVDEDPLTFNWTLDSQPEGSIVELSDSSTVNPTFTPDVAGAYKVQLIVNDGKVDSTADTATIMAQPRMVEVPNVVALPQAAAEAAILAAKLLVGAITFEHSETVAEDHVISQNPAAGTSVVENSAVDLTISLGSENQSPSVSFSASPSSIEQGGTSTLSWSSLRAETAHIDNGIGSVAVEGNTVVSPEHTTTYTITMTGPAGSANAKVTVQVTASPEPQPEGSYGEQYEDLVPEDATVEQYDPERFSLITGLVQDINELPLPGVTITIHGFARYGSVATDDQGRFSIPVEGGGTLTVVYQKQGLIQAQRKVYVPWNDNVVAETIVMISEDP